MFLRINHALNFLRRNHFACAVFVMLIILALEGWFLYHYFYRSLTATKALLELRQQAALEELHIPLYEKATALSKARLQIPAIDTKKLPDPFTASVSSPLAPRR